MGVITTLARKAAGIFVKKVTTVNQEGEHVTKKHAREGVKGAGWIIGFLLLWHFIIQPVLCVHFPQYDFPALDFGWVTGIFLGV